MVNELVSVLFQSRLQAHIFHLRTKSYANHIALDDYYSDIVPLLDRLAETCNGHHGLMEYFKKYGVDNDGDVVQYFVGLLDQVQRLREDSMFDFADCQAIIDEIEELISITIYKLQYLS